MVPRNSRVAEEALLCHYGTGLALFILALFIAASVRPPLSSSTCVGLYYYYGGP